MIRFLKDNSHQISMKKINQSKCDFALLKYLKIKLEISNINLQK